MEMSSMIVKNKELGMGWIGLGAQAWIDFFCEKHFTNEAFNFPWHKEEGEIVPFRVRYDRWIKEVKTHFLQA